MTGISPQQILPATRALITVAVMSASLMQVLDTTIVNVALPHMQGSLGSSSSEITWVLTSYLVASAIFMPLTGYFTEVFGRKKYLLVSIAGFVIASILCGAAVNITEIVFFRLLQGIFGAGLVPISQAIMTDVFPEEERGTAMAIWGIGVMVGPILGPTLGGYLTEVATWRWNFYINVPVGILSYLLCWRIVPDTPKHDRQMDWLGLLLISITIGATQYVLDRGSQDDWFDSSSICVITFLAVTCMLSFLLHCTVQKKKSVFDISIFNDRNFTLASLTIAMLGLGLFGGMVVLPLMLENLFDYPVLTTGLVMAPRGIAGMLSMMIVGKLINFVDPRKLIVTGILISCLGLALCTHYNLGISPGWIIGPIIIQGLGLGMIFVPISAIAFSTLPAHSRAEAAGLFSLLRTLGSSIGISIVSTVLARQTQIAWNQLGGFINPYNPAVAHYLHSLNMRASHPLAPSVLVSELARQAQMVAFMNVFAFIAWSVVSMLPLVFLLKKPKMKKMELATEMLE